MSGSAITPPKGRATRARNDTARGRTVSPRVQWALVIILALVVAGIFFYLGRDVRSDLNGAGQPHAPVEVGAVAVATAHLG